MSRFVTALLAALAYLVAGPALAYPDKPIRYIVPYPAGGVSDLLARVFADAMSKSLGQRVIVENLPGASGIIASQAAARAEPDGYTLFQGETVTQVMNAMRKNKLPYDVDKSFDPISMLAESPTVIVVPPASPMKSMDDFFTSLKTSKGNVIFPSGGTGTLMHLTTELLLREFGAKGQIVSYSGTPRIFQDLLAGELKFAIPNVPPALPHMKSGSLRSLAVLSRERLSNFPDIPTVGERVPGFSASNWYAVYAPAGTPAAVRARLDAVVHEVLADKVLKEKLVNQGFVLRAGTADEIRRFTASERERYGKIVEQLGLTLE